MDINRKKSRFNWKLFGFFLLFLFVFLNLDIVFPVKHFSITDIKQTDWTFPEDLKRYSLVFDIYTTKSNLSVASEKDILQSLNKNNIDITLLTDCNFFSSKVEGIYGDKVLISKCHIKNKTIYYDNFAVSFGQSNSSNCVEIYNLTKGISFNILNISSLFKFMIFYPFSTEKSYKNLLDFNYLSLKLPDFSKNPCYISGTGYYGRVKFLEKDYSITILDPNKTLSLVYNKLYLKQDITSDLQTTKELIFNAIKNGNLISIYYPKLDVDIVAKQNQMFMPVGSVLNIDKSPEIFVKLSKGNILLTVYKNGKLKSVFNEKSFVLKPDSEGYYTFVLYSYNIHIPFGIYLGVQPIAFLGNFYIQ